MRPSWDRYFLDLAQAAATRSTCDRAHVGCVLVKDRQVIATGYNGSLPGMPHCDDVGHLLVNNSCLRCSHGENGAVCSAARRGVPTEGSTAYITHTPCWGCFRLLVQAGVRVAVFADLKLGGLTPEIFQEMIAAPMKLVNSDGVPFDQLVVFKDGTPAPNEAPRGPTHEPQTRPSSR